MSLSSLFFLGIFFCLRFFLFDGKTTKSQVNTNVWSQGLLFKTCNFPIFPTQTFVEHNAPRHYD